MTGVMLLATGLVPIAMASPAAATPAPGVVHVYPSPGTSTISLRQSISFRGVSASALPSVTVTGSASGAHHGRWVVTSDGGGATWEPATAFTAGEQVTVSSSATMAGTPGHSFTYTVARPAAVSAQQLAAEVNAADAPTAAPSTQLAPAVTAATVVAPIVDSTKLAAPSAAQAPSYITRPDLHPPAIATTVPGTTAPGLLLSTPLSIAPIPTGPVHAAEISNNRGQLIWLLPVPGGATNLQIINYMGHQDLAYHNNEDPTCDACTQFGFWTVLDNHYNQVATINPDGGYLADAHALEISPDGTKALVESYNPVIVDDSANGGPSDLQVIEGVVQEIDLATGAMDFEWHSLSNDSNGQQFVPLQDSYLPPVAGSTFDYLHINSMQYVDNDTILFSGRHTSTVYKLSLSTGQILWRLGGKDTRSQFAFADGDGGPSFAHDVQLVSPGPADVSSAVPGPVTQISVFDNGVLRSPPYSRGVVFDLNEGALTATVAKQWVHSPNLYGLATGSNRLQSNGDQLISYGTTGYADEFDQNGNVVWASQVQPSASGYQVFSYRTVRAVWHGQPQTPPAIVVKRTSPTAAQVTSSWNGATDVTAWQLYGGATSSHLAKIGPPVTKASFETSIAATVPSTDTVFQMRALDTTGATLGISPITGDAIATHYANLGGASSFLGAATGGEQTTGSGLVQYYQGGAIYWSAPTGAFSVHGAILAQYQSLGGPTGILGFPTSDEATAAPNGRTNTFQGGNIYWSPATGAFEVQGAILSQYLALGGTAGILGFPTSNETAAPPNGRVSTFQGGNIYWSTATGAFEVQGAILSQYLALGGPASFLGFPTSNEFSPTPGTRQSNFQFGHHILYNFADGTTTVQ